MELFLFFMIVALGGVWWLNHTLRKSAERKATEAEKEIVPYKVEPQVAEAPKAEPAKCGCGRSPTGFCVGLHKLTAEEWSTHADNPNRVVAVEPEVKAEKKPARAAKGSKAVVKKTGAKKSKASKA